MIRKSESSSNAFLYTFLFFFLTHERCYPGNVNLFFFIQQQTRCITVDHVTIDRLKDKYFLLKIQDPLFILLKSICGDNYYCFGI